MIPEPIKKKIEESTGARILSSTQVSGGSINRAARIELGSSGTCFLKWNSRADPDMFAKEVKGLEMLKAAETGLIIPGVMDQGVVDRTTGYLVLDYIEEGTAREGSHEQFGRELAALHQVHNDRFGLDHDNYIGRLPQSNTWHDRWTDFFIHERMEPQLKMAVDAGKLSASVTKAFDNMYEKLPGIMPEEDPSLLHGDLWGGNYFYNAEGNATLYDPAVYYGNREIELAFTHLFGGFSGDFYQAYNETWALQPGFRKRIDIYNLYPLLVHTNLFGGHYGSRVASIVRRFA